MRSQKNMAIRCVRSTIVISMSDTHTLQINITPSYCARSAPVEVMWANLKNPISRVCTRSLSELEDQVTKVVAHKLTESCWIGAYKTTRQWEDTMWAELRPDVDVQEDSCDDSSLEGAMEGDEQDNESTQ